MVHTLFGGDIAGRGGPGQRRLFDYASRVTLVHANGERHVRMASVDADDGKIDAPQFVPEPARHRSGFKADAFGMRRTFSEQFSQRAWIGLCFALEDHLPSLVDHAY